MSLSIAKNEFLVSISYYVYHFLHRFTVSLVSLLLTFHCFSRFTVSLVSLFLSFHCFSRFTASDVSLTVYVFVVAEAAYPAVCAAKHQSCGNGGHGELVQGVLHDVAYSPKLLEKV